MDKQELQKLILSTKSNEYKIEVLKNEIESEKLKVGPILITKTLLLINDKEYIREFLQDDYNIDKFGLGIEEICKLIKALDDKEYIKNILKDSQEMKRLKINNYGLKLLLKELDYEYIYELIQDKEKQKELGILKNKENNHKNKKEILVEYASDENIKRILTDEEKIKKYEFDNIDIIELALKTKDEEILKSKVEELKKIKVGLNAETKKIKLPLDITFGIEIESEGRGSRIVEDMTDKIEESWKCVKDSTLKDGIELVSPVMNSKYNIAAIEIENVCNFLKNLEQEISVNCGGHVHIGAKYLNSIESWKNLMEIWGNTEKILYIISNDQWDITRESAFKYAKPISKKFELKLKDNTIDIKNEEDIKWVLKDSQLKERVYGINFKNITDEPENKHKNTIEFRLSNGTLDANTWVENINLYGGIVRASQEIAEIQIKKEKTELTKEEQEKLAEFEQIREKDLTDEEKLKKLLFLVIDEEDRDIYIKRFESNSQLFEENPEIKEELFSKLANENIKLDESIICKKVFEDDDSVTLEEINEITEELTKDLEIYKRDL